MHTFRWRCERHELLRRRTDYLGLRLGENRGESGEGLLLELLLNHLMAMLLHMTRPNMPDFHLFGHSNNTDRLLLRPHR